MKRENVIEVISKMIDNISYSKIVLATTNIINK